MPMGGSLTHTGFEIKKMNKEKISEIEGERI
jgi:hypothetical protein